MENRADFAEAVEAFKEWKPTVEKPGPGYDAGVDYADIAAVIAGSKPCSIIMPMNRRHLKPWLDYARAQNVYVRNFRPEGCGYYTVLGDKQACDLLVTAWLRLFGLQVQKPTVAAVKAMRECHREIGLHLGYPADAVEAWLVRWDEWGP